MLLWTFHIWGKKKKCLHRHYLIISVPYNWYRLPILHVVVAQLLSHIWFFTTPWSAAHQTSLSFAVSQSLLKFLSIESVILSSHLILCHALLLLPSTFSSIRVFSNELAFHIKWPNYWSFSVGPSSEIFRVDFLYSWLVWYVSSPRTFQESSPAPQFKSISSSQHQNMYII